VTCLFFSPLNFRFLGTPSDPGILRRVLVQVFKRLEGKLEKDAPLQPFFFNLVTKIRDQSMLYYRQLQKKKLLGLGKMDVNSGSVAQVLETLSKEAGGSRPAEDKPSGQYISRNFTVLSSTPKVKPSQTNVTNPKLS
jgi:hypothetical protein